MAQPNPQMYGRNAYEQPTTSYGYGPGYSNSPYRHGPMQYQSPYGGYRGPPYAPHGGYYTDEAMMGGPPKAGGPPGGPATLMGYGPPGGPHPPPGYTNAPPPFGQHQMPPSAYTAVAGTSTGGLPPPQAVYPGAPQTAPPTEQSRVYKCCICKRCFFSPRRLKEHIAEVELSNYRPCECKPCDALILDEIAYSDHCKRLPDREHEFVDYRMNPDLERKREQLKENFEASMGSYSVATVTTHPMPQQSFGRAPDEDCVAVPSGVSPAMQSSRSTGNPPADGNSPVPTEVVTTGSREPSRKRTNQNSGLNKIQCQLCALFVEEKFVRRHVFVKHINQPTVLCPVDDCEVTCKYSVKKMKEHIDAKHPGSNDLIPRVRKGRYLLKAKYLEPQCFPRLKHKFVQWTLKPQDTEVTLSSGEEDNAAELDKGSPDTATEQQVENSDGEDSDTSEDEDASTSTTTERDSPSVRLLTAVRDGDLAKVKTLLGVDAIDVNAASDDVDANTPLHIACQKNQMDIAFALLEAGADPDKPNGNECSALDLAPKKLMVKLEKFLQDQKLAKRAKKSASKSADKKKPVAKTPSVKEDRNSKAFKVKANRKDESDDSAAESTPYNSSESGSDASNETPVEAKKKKKLSARRRTAEAVPVRAPDSEQESDYEDQEDTDKSSVKKSCRVCSVKTTDWSDHVWSHLGKEGRHRYECQCMLAAPTGKKGKAPKRGDSVCPQGFYVRSLWSMHAKQQHAGQDTQAKDNERLYRAEFRAMRRRCFG